MPKGLYNFVEQLKRTGSINEKLSMLESNRNNNMLQLFFRYSLGKEKYGVKKIPEYSHMSNKYTFNDGLNILDQLSARKITGNKAIAAVKNYLENTSVECANLFERMLKKFPDCGVSQTLCNRIWTDMFPKEIKLNKAQPYSAKALEEIHYPAISQCKMDGARMLAFVDDMGVTLYTSSGKEYLKLDNLKKQFSMVYQNMGFQSAGTVIFDGELLVIDSDGKIMPRKEGNGILNKSIHNTISEQESKQVVAVIWDVIYQDEYDNGVGRIKYADKMKLLAKIKTTYIRCVESKVVNSKEEAFEHFQSMLNRGEEGTILKNLDMVWEGKRSKNCVKFKIVIENTLKIVGFQEGTGKFENNLGALLCESSDGLVSVKIGSGISDEIRKSIWTDQNKYLGTFVEISSNGLIKATDGTYSLFLPRLSDIRFDKTEADDFETIKALSDGSTMLKKLEGNEN